jgi:hypothetical protein
MDPTPVPDAPALLTLWVARRPGRRGILAARLHVAESTVWRWCARRSVPRPMMRELLRRATRIPAEAWEVQS